jgi:hypothetical protein
MLTYCCKIGMRGFCSRCKEYRSDDGLDAWKIVWQNGRPTCERCKGYVDVWDNEEIRKGCVEI